MTLSAPSVVGAPVKLRCEYTVNPLGIDNVTPRLSWQMAHGRRGARQTAYQLRVSTLRDMEAKPATLWDTGKVVSDASIQIRYGGRKLKSRQRAYWQVKVWDAEGVESPWSEPALWEMGLLKQEDWEGMWIGLPFPAELAAEDSAPATYLRRDFNAPAAVAAARLYITACGVYEPYLNGQRIGGAGTEGAAGGADLFTPGWTDYNKRLRYQTYDVTGLVKPGENTLGAILGDGWYAGNVGFMKAHGIYGKEALLLAQLHITYEDGSTETVLTDPLWRGTQGGPIRSSDMLMGETYDARMDLGAWACAGYEAGQWAEVTASPRVEGELIAQVGPTVQYIGELGAKELWQDGQGRWVFDLGQNMVGVARLKYQGQPGETVTLRFAEMLNPDRSIYTTNLRRAKATDTYTLGSGNLEMYTPRFTYHGFRYVELSSSAGTVVKPAIDAVTGVVLHSATRETGAFECSNAKLNQLQHNILWGQKGNFVEVPTDCPQRDERLGWMGDAQVFIRTAAFNMDVAGFFNKWMLDVEDAQTAEGAFTDVVPNIMDMTNPNWKPYGTAAWAEAGIICPWTVYLCYGDKQILADRYESMCGYIAYMKANSVELIRPEAGYGDWLAIGSETHKALIGTAFFAYAASLMEKIAGVLGKKGDARKFGRLFKDVKKAFSREFVTAGGRMVSHSQTADVLALRFGLVDEPAKGAVIAHLCADIEKRGVITTGFVGCNLILPTLTQIGRDDLAYKLLLSEKFPGWLFPVNHGATTIWERWDGWTPEKGFQDAGMNSFNHYAYGSCGEWMYAHLAGLDLDAERPGYKHAVIWPKVGGGITSAKAELETMYGVVGVKWWLADGVFHLTVKVPANTTATVVLPTTNPSDIHEDDTPLGPLPAMQIMPRATNTALEVGAGEYGFTCGYRAVEGNA